MDRFAGRYLVLDGIEKADEFLMPVALHTAPADLAFTDIKGVPHGVGVGWRGHGRDGRARGAGVGRARAGPCPGWAAPLRKEALLPAPAPVFPLADGACPQGGPRPGGTKQ